MKLRAFSAIVCFGMLALVAVYPARAHATGEYTTANFIVSAPNQQIAQKVGEYAERWRREKAMEWLGREMPNWGKKCPLQVTVTPSGSSGETTFAFDNGSILDQRMQVAGSLERIVNSVLPHEITHTVFAYKFRQPLPRWADEGGSVLSEDDQERQKHDDLIRRYLAKGNQAYRLRTLMTMMQYPRTGEDVITLYAEGYSIVRFLVESSSKQAFLSFLADGIQPQIGWDRAIQKHFGLKNIEQLEQLWLKWMLAWCSPQARLQNATSAATGNTLVASNAMANQSQVARVDSRTTSDTAGTRGKLGTSVVIRGGEPDRATLNDQPVTPQPADRPWSPINNEAAPPSSPGWKPLRASLGQPIPQQ